MDVREIRFHHRLQHRQHAMGLPLGADEDADAFPFSVGKQGA
jgi:hypothetical protein